MTQPPPHNRIGESLVEQGVLSSEQLQDALRGQQESGLRLGEYLVTEGVLNANTLVRSLGKRLGVPGCVLRHGLIDPAVMELIGSEEAERLKVLPLFKIRDTLTVAMAEPQSLPTLDVLKRATGLTIRPVLVLESNINEFLGKYTGENVDVDVFLASLTESDVQVVEGEKVDEGPVTDIDKLVEGSPVVNIVNLALMTAVRDGASDIHVEPSRAGTLIRYRIDGVLRELMNPPAGMHAAIASRIKVISAMDIAEKRLPQEGRIRIVAAGRGIDLRVSSMPTLLGEKLVIRILDKSNLEVRMEHLGFQDVALETFQRILHQPHGLALVTGPTGSGKTTTLYSALELLRSPEVNLLTVEDPVEYQLDLINQVQVQDAIGFTFARALRSILRQDPDVIMVGEIRDTETARVAVQAALTGHLVLATLHTNDAASTVSRLADMGIEAYLLSGALNGVVAQRLVRTLCGSCITKYYPTEHVLLDAGLTEHAGRPFQKGSGCQECHNSGFKGRMGVYEVMEVTDRIRRLVHLSAPSMQIQEELRRQGVGTLREEGVAIALSGRTSLEEVLRATRIDDEFGDADIERKEGRMKLAYTAVDKRGTSNNDTIEAPSIADATELLRQRGLYVTDIKEAGRTNDHEARPSRRRGGGSSLKNLAMWSRQLCVLLRAGTPLAPALAAVEHQVPEGPWRSVLEDVRNSVEGGQPLSEALGAHPEVFDEVSRSLVQAGESAGILGEMLDRTALLIRQQLRVRQSISGAMVYPVLLVAVGIVVTLVMIIGVLPRFSELFETMNAPLPATTQMLIALSGVIMKYWWAILIGLAVSVVGGKLFVSGPTGRRRLDGWLVRLPIAGKVVRSLATAKIARLLGVMLESKVSLLDALGLVKNATGNLLYADLLDDAMEATSRGEAISAVFSRTELITPSVTEALRHGEQNAQIGPIMSDMADFLDEENEVVVKAAMSVLEPLILIALGLVVGFIALSMFIPLFDLTSLAGGG